MSKRARTEWVPGPLISPDLLEELRLFRTQFVRLKPGVAPEQDRSKLRRYFAHPGSRVAIFRGDKRELLGFCGFCDEAVDICGRSVCVMTPEYFFLSRSLRGTGLMARTALRWLIGVFARHPLSPKYGMALNFPVSFVAGTRTMGDFKLPLDPELSPLDQTLFDWFHRTRLGDLGDRRTGVTQLDTLPPDLRPRSSAGQRALKRYEDHNPTWREGYAIPVLMSFGVAGGRALYNMVSDAGRRSFPGPSTLAATSPGGHGAGRGGSGHSPARSRG